LRPPDLLARAGAFGRQPAQDKAGLPPADQFQIDLGQDFGVQKRAVQRPRRIVDAEAAAQRVERCGRARKPLRAIASVSTARSNGIAGIFSQPNSALMNFMSNARCGSRASRRPRTRRRRRDLPEQRLVTQEVVAKAVNLERLLRHRALGLMYW
jgi:hypothetical protein